MALAPVTKTVHRHLRSKELIITLTPTGNYVNTGDTLNLTTLTAPLGTPDALIGFPGTITDYRVIDSPAGYIGKLIPGATLATWKLEVFQQSAAAGPLPQIAAAAYPAGVLAGTFTISLTGPKGRV